MTSFVVVDLRIVLFMNFRIRIYQITNKLRNDNLKNESGLKQCPFCGSKWTQARYINHPFDEHHVYGGYRGECTDCGVTTKAYKTREEAVDAWNMRSCEVDDE